MTNTPDFSEIIANFSQQIDDARAVAREEREAARVELEQRMAELSAQHLAVFERRCEELRATLFDEPIDPRLRQ